MKWIFLLFFVVMPSAMAQTPVEFITEWYRGYLNAEPSQRNAYAESHPFYSTNVKEAAAANDEACARLRGDDLCGYFAEADPYLEAQDFDGKLNFESSGFKAQAVGPHEVEVSFRLFPNDPPRTIRHKFVEEKGGWRVDSGIAEHIRQENERLAKLAKDLPETWSWIAIYAKHRQPEKFSRFLTRPVELCESKKHCKFLTLQGPRLREVLKKLELPPKIHANPSAVYHKGPLTLKLKDWGWFITKIELYQ